MRRGKMLKGIARGLAFSLTALLGALLGEDLQGISPWIVFLFGSGIGFCGYFGWDYSERK